MLQIMPLRADHFSAEHNKRIQDVLIEEPQKVLRYLWRISIVFVPIWIRIQWSRVSMGGDVACAARLATFVPCATDSVVS